MYYTALATCMPPFPYTLSQDVHNVKPSIVLCRRTPTSMVLYMYMYRCIACIKSWVVSSRVSRIGWVLLWPETEEPLSHSLPLRGGRDHHQRLRHTRDHPQNQRHTDTGPLQVSGGGIRGVYSGVARSSTNRSSPGTCMCLIPIPRHLDVSGYEANPRAYY